MGGPRAKTGRWLTQRHMDIAASIQAVTEVAVGSSITRYQLRLADSLSGRWGRAQLRGKWKSVAFEQGRSTVDSSRLRAMRGGGGCGACGLSSPLHQTSPSAQRYRRHDGKPSRSGV